MRSTASLTLLLPTRLRTKSGTEWNPSLPIPCASRAICLSNALRHGQATEVELALQHANPNGLLFTISDSGKGCDPSKSRGQGHGLANLEVRADGWKGVLRVESRPRGPTRLALTFALDRGKTARTYGPTSAFRNYRTVGRIQTRSDQTI